LTELIDWAKHNTRSTVFSCLAAHAGVLHLDGIERRPLPEKCFGVFAFTGQRDHPFVGKQGRPRLIPHSRYNGLLQSDLERAGYDILASSPVHGVDSFAKTSGSQFVFLQGHPEYDSSSLAREYRRDMGRYLRGDLERAPSIPIGYFTVGAEAKLSALERRARKGPCQLPLEELSTIDALAPPQAEWRDTAVSFYCNWVGSIVASTCRMPFDA
jgi:homoserine O-succinyltransferase/O-acetyltransferase